MERAVGVLLKHPKHGSWGRISSKPGAGAVLQLVDVSTRTKERKTEVRRVLGVKMRGEIVCGG